MIDGYAFEARNLAPRTNQDKMLSVNAAIRQHLGKQAGDTVRVTMYQDASPSLNTEADLRACLADAGVLPQLNAFRVEEQRAMLGEVLAQPDEAGQERKILALIAALAGS